MGDLEATTINLDNLIIQLDVANDDSADADDEDKSRASQGSRRAVEDYLEQKRLQRLLEDDFLDEWAE